MNNSMLAASALSLVLATGCATNSKRMVGDVDANLSNATGGNIRWLRDESDREEVQRTIESLLQHELTETTAIQIALLNNRRVQAELEEIGIAQAELIQAGRLRNPEFSASFRFPDRPPRVTNTEYSITAELLDLIFLPYRKRLAAQNVEQAQLRAASAVLELAHEVKLAFYEVQAAQQLMGRLKLMEEVNEAAGDLAKRQHDAGNITDLELANHQATHAQSRIAYAETERELRKLRQSFNRLLGLWGSTTKWTVGSQLAEIPKEETPFDSLESQAVEQRKDLAALRRRMDSTGAALALKRKTRFAPTNLSVGVDTEREPDKTRLTGPSVSLELPIFDQGQGAIAQLGAEYRMTQRAFEALAVDIRAEVNTAIDAVIANRDLAEYYRTTVLPQQIKIVNETLLHYNAMQVPTFELLAAKERELNAEREYVGAWRDYWIARADLEKAVGGRLNLSESSKPPRTPIKKTSSEHDHHNHQDSK